MANILKCKPLGMLMEEASETGEYKPEAGPGPLEPDHAGHRRHHRRGNFRPHRLSRGSVCRNGYRAVVHPRRRRLGVFAGLCSF